MTKEQLIARLEAINCPKTGEMRHQGAIERGFELLADFIDDDDIRTTLMAVMDEHVEALADLPFRRTA